MKKITKGLMAAAILFTLFFLSGCTGVSNDPPELFLPPAMGNVEDIPPAKANTITDDAGDADFYLKNMEDIFYNLLFDGIVFGENPDDFTVTGVLDDAQPFVNTIDIDYTWQAEAGETSVQAEGSLYAAASEPPAGELQRDTRYTWSSMQFRFEMEGSAIDKVFDYDDYDSHRLSGNIISEGVFAITVYRITGDTKGSEDTFDIEWTLSHRYGLAAAVVELELESTGARYLFSFADQVAGSENGLSQADYHVVQSDWNAFFDELKPEYTVQFFDNENSKIGEFIPDFPKDTLWEMLRGYFEMNYTTIYFGDI